MILKKIAMHGDYLLYKTNRRTPFYMNIGGFTEELREDVCRVNHIDRLNGYNHIARFEEDTEYIVHATPPRVTRTKLTDKYLKKAMRKADLEIWRITPRIDEAKQSRITETLYDIGNLKWNPKKKKWQGLRYDWAAIIFAPLSLFNIFGGLNGKRRLHCAEMQAEAAKQHGIILSSQGKYDSLVSPNNIINGKKISKIYTFKKEDL